MRAAGTVRTFHLGRLTDIGFLVGLPGITPLELQGDRFVARVADAEAALAELRRAGFSEAALDA